MAIEPAPTPDQLLEAAHKSLAAGTVSFATVAALAWHTANADPVDSLWRI
jgi:hypothetical protein